MNPDLPQSGPAIEYLLKEVSYSTCDNKFFGELEKEMLIPNNINIFGKVRGARSLRDCLLRAEFPDETAVGYVKEPLSNTVEGQKRVLTYKLEDLINYEDYWWVPLDGETEFSLRMNLLPPFPSLRPVGLQMSCRPDVAIGLQTSVTTEVRLEADEDVDHMFLRFTAPMRAMPGIFIAIDGYSDDDVTEPRQTVVTPKRDYPFPRLGMKKGESLEYKVSTKIVGDPASMQFLRCEQDILTAKLLTMQDSTPSGLPCGISILDKEQRDIPIQKTIRSTVLQATAQVMYSPFSVHLERRSTQPRAVVEVPAN